MLEMLGIALLTFFATSISTLAGFGASTIMIPLLQLFLPAHETLILVGFIHLFNNVWRITLFRQFNLRLIVLFGTPSVVTAYLGARLAISTPSAFLSQLLGLFLIVYIIMQLRYPNLQIKKNIFNALVGGSLAGFFTGIFGIGGTIRSAFLTAFNIPRIIYLSTLGAIGILVDGVRVATYLNNEVSVSQWMIFTLACSVPASFLGVWTSKKISHNFSHEQFRKTVIIFLALASIKLLIWPIA